jgi:hypothetical protein
VSNKISELQSVFDRLRDLLAAHASEFALAFDATARYGLKAPVGPATLRSWGGKVRTPSVPVGWVEIRKAKETPLPELETVTAESFAGLRRAGFIAAGDEPNDSA